ncbi:MAG: gliding motility-associated C-terminal domain-containing protein [Bacteroidetes bacterium]|nr:gliding motility-associated C-terminal domain-containing protein [Bacteroidota bacterium]
MGATALVAPQPLTCATTYSTTEPITVRVFNYSAEPVTVTNMPIQVAVTGMATVTHNETWSGTIDAESSVDITLAGTVNMTAGGTYQFLITTGLPGDAYTANNSVAITRSNRINAFPYLERFNANNGGWVSSSTTDSRWEWGPLPPAYTVDGPDGLGSSWRLIQAGSTNPFVESPHFNLSATTNPAIKFKIKMDINSPGGWNGVYVQYSTNNGANWTDLGTVADPTWYGAAPHGTSNSWGGLHSGTTRRTVGNWLQVERNLCPIPVAQRSCVKFRFITRSLNTSNVPFEFAFDDFEIVDDAPDVGATLIVSPGSGTAAGCDYSQSTQVTVRVHNFRCQAVNNIPLTVDVTGPTPQSVTEQVPTVAGNSFVDYTFTAPLDLRVVGAYTLTATTHLPGDVTTANDATTSPATVTVPTIDTYPYVQNFNADNGLWQGDISAAGQQEWAWGPLPASYTVDGAEGQGSSWRLIYNAGSANNVVNLTSPIFDLSTINNPEMTFDFKLDINSQGGWNGVFMQYTLDNGNTWATLGDLSTPDWYSLAPHGTSISWGALHSGATRRTVGNWTQARIRLCDLGGQSCVRFRFTLRSPNRTLQPFEFAMDNFFIGNPEPYDISLLNIEAPGTSNCTAFTGSENVTVVIESDACVPLRNLPVSVQVSGPTNVMLNGVVPVVPRKGRVTYTFPTQVNMATVGTYTFTASVSLPPTAPPVTPEPNLANNTLTHIRTSVPITTFPYVQNFDANNGGFAPRPVNPDFMWLWGPLPSTYTVDGPDGQGSSWRLYTPGGSSAVQPTIETPHFNLSGLQNPVIAFDIKMDINSSGGWNGVYVEYSTNGGTNWTLLGATAQDPTWYGAAPHGTNNSWGAMTTGNTRRTIGDWLHVERNLCPIPVAQRGCVKFRIITRSINASQSPREFAIDNFTIFSNAPDVAVSAILEPQSSASGACGTVASTRVILRVHNYRCDPVSNVPVTINASGAGTASLSEVVPAIAGNSFVDYTFSTTLDLGNIGNYTLRAFTSLAGDVNTGNDTTTSQISVTVPTIDTYPYFQDFNADNGNWEGQVDNPDQGWFWGPLPPAYTVDGPDGQGSSWRLGYTAGTANPVVNLISPIFDLSAINDPELSFDFKLDINSSGGWNGVFMQYTLDNGGVWTTLGDLTTPDWYNLAPHGTSVSWGGLHSGVTRRTLGDWVQARIRLCDLGGQSCVRFRFTLRSPNRTVQPYQFAMDNFSIADPRPYDISLLNIEAPASVNCTAYSNAETVTIVIENDACVPIRNLPVTAVITGPVNVTLNGVVPSVPRRGRVTFTFPGTVNMSANGTYTITASVSLPADAPPVTPEANLANNTLTHTRTSTRINTYPYVQTFDTDNGGFVPRPVNADYMWLWGLLPAAYAVDGPDGQGSSWRLYTPGGGTVAQPIIETPVFDLSMLSNPQLSFDIKMDINSSGGWNGVYVEYSINGGSNWTLLGNVNEPTWYGAAPHGTNNSFGAPTSGVTRRTIGDWMRVSRNLCAISGQACVKFRIITRSINAGVSPQEFALDNFRIESGAPDAGVGLVLQPTTGGNSACSYREQVPTQVRVFNFNCAPMAGVPVVMEVTGPVNTTLTETIPIINANTSVDYTFTGQINLSLPGTYNLRAYSNLSPDADNSNDTAVRVITVLSPIVNTFPYLETFNANDGQWQAGGTTPTATWEWTYGELPPTYTSGGPQGAGNSWRLTATSGSGDLFLYSPVFDFTGVNNPELAFDFKLDMNSPGGWNGVFMEVSTNGGQNWTQLGDLTTPNWYNLAPHGTSNSWGGNHSGVTRRTVPGWTQAQYLLCAYANQSCVQFRFRTRSPNQSNQPNQFAVDNFTVTNTPLDAELTSVVGCYGAQYQLEIGIRNRQRCPGAPAITSAQLTYELNGVRTTVPLTGLNIAPNATQIVNIPNVVVPDQSATLRAWVKLPNGLVDQLAFNDSIVANLNTFPNCNDHCANAIPLAIGTTLASQNDRATINDLEDGVFAGCPPTAGETGTAPGREQTVWYTFSTGPAGGELTVSFTDIVSVPNTGIQVEIMAVTGPDHCNPADRATVYCTNPGPISPIVYGPTTYPANTTYMIMVDGVGGNSSSFNILIEGDALAPVTGGTIAQDQTVCVGNTPNPLTNVVAASSGVLPYRYQWQSAPAAAGPWTDIPSANGVNYSMPQANTAGTFYYRRKVTDDDGAGNEAFSNVVTLSVTADLTPPALAAASPACETTTLSAAGTPPAGVAWYWQANGQSTVADPAQEYDPLTPRIITASNTFYIRAYNGVCWSDVDSLAIVVDHTPAVPGALSAVSPACLSTEISTAGTPPTGVAWYWQTSASGTSTSDEYTGPRTVTADGTYFLRANRGTCWSTAVSVDVEILPTPAAPVLAATPGNTVCAGSISVAATSTPAAGETYYWQTSATGESTADAYTAPRDKSLPGDSTLHLRAYNGTCWGSAASLTVSITTAPTADAGPNVEDICGDRALLSPVGSGTWQVVSPAGASVVFVGNEAIGLTEAAYIFEYTVTVPGCPPATDLVTVTREQGTADFVLAPAQLMLPDNNLLTLVNASAVPNGSTYTWTFTGGTPAGYTGDTPPQVQYFTPGTYPVALRVESPAGCVYTRTATVLVEENRPVIVLPNVFTPNNDGINDLWPGTQLPWPSGVDIQIFNRWGVLIYQGKNQWDGKSNGRDVPEGVYYYIWNAPGMATRSGDVTVIR